MKATRLYGKEVAVHSTLQETSVLPQHGIAKSAQCGFAILGMHQTALEVAHSASHLALHRIIHTDIPYRIARVDFYINFVLLLLFTSKYIILRPCA